MRQRPTEDAPLFLLMLCAECGRTRAEHMDSSDDHMFEPVDAWAQRKPAAERGGKRRI